VALEVLVIVLVVMLAGVTTAMAITGSLGIVGDFHYERCARCGHVHLERRGVKGGQHADQGAAQAIGEPPVGRGLTPTGQSEHQIWPIRDNRTDE
jgi:hypothetical protein